MEVAELIQADDDLFNKVYFQFINDRVAIVYCNDGYCYSLLIVIKNIFQFPIIIRIESLQKYSDWSTQSDPNNPVVT